MFKNYVLVALRNMAKQKLFTTINILGLVIGLMALILANGLINYEENFDEFFPDSDRIYAIAGHVNPNAGQPISWMVGIPTPVGPLTMDTVPEVEATSRMMPREMVARVEDSRFYQDIRFVDPAFLDIFQFEFIEGSAESALEGVNNLVLTESAAEKYFGSADAFGQTIRIDNARDMVVSGVIRDIPPNSHLRNSVLGPVEFQILGNIKAFEEIRDIDLANRWFSTSMNDLTYAKLRPGTTPAQTLPGFEQLMETHSPERQDFITDLFLIPVREVNLAVWDGLGVPVPQSIRIIGVMVLLIAIINYSNLTNAQYMSRVREIGLRKSMGSSRRQLMLQFFTESIVYSFIALIIAIWLIAMLLGPINTLAQREFSLAGLLTPEGLATLAGITLFTGLAGGIYPAMKISRTPAAACLSDRGIMDGGRGWLRNTIVALQFGFAILLASSATIIFAQNVYLDKSANVFDRNNTILLERISRPTVMENFDTMKNEILRVPGVEYVTGSNNVPFNNSSDNWSMARVAGDEANEVSVLAITHDIDFMKTYGIDILYGRDFDRNVALDTVQPRESEDAPYPQRNVILNIMAANQFGWDDPADALGQSLYFSNPESSVIEHRIIGIVPNMNYRGAPARVKAMIFEVRPEFMDTMAIKLAPEGHAEAIRQIDAIWNRLNPEFPLERRSLYDVFMDVYQLLQGLAAILGGFALVAVFVAFIGLFGLSAFVSKVRTKEIGIRKVLGAPTMRLVRLMVMNISIPVLIAMVPAAGLAWAAMSFGYLQMFPDRVGGLLGLISLSSIAVLMLAWAVVSYHAWRTANASPINALRYE